MRVLNLNLTFLIIFSGHLFLAPAANSSTGKVLPAAPMVTTLDDENFGDVMVTKSVTKNMSVTYYCKGACPTGPVTFNPVSRVSGSAEFTVVNNSCANAVVYPNGWPYTCNWSVKFAPTSVGAKSAVFRTSCTAVSNGCDPADHNTAGNGVAVTTPGIQPSDAKIDTKPIQDKPFCAAGSSIDIENQILGESIPIVGVPASLVYRSDRTPAHLASYKLSIPVWPASTDGFSRTVTIQVDGRESNSATYSAPNTRHNFTWDGADAANNPVKVPRKTTITIRTFKSGYDQTTTRTTGLGTFDHRNLGLGGWTLSNNHFLDIPNNTIYFGSGGSRKVTPIIRNSTSYYVPNSDGNEIYRFGSDGRHYVTHHGLTNGVLFNFTYDASTGRLNSMSDRSGNITTFTPGTNSTVINSPYNQVTTLAFNANGWLQSVTNPKNQTHQLTYTSGTPGLKGQLYSFQKPGGETSTFLYDTDGHLTKDSHSGGFFLTLARTLNDQGWKITSTNAANVTTTNELWSAANETLRETKNAYGQLSTRKTRSDSATNTVTVLNNLSTGAQNKDVLVPDPRFPGNSYSKTASSYISYVYSQDVEFTKSVQLANNDPLSLTSLTVEGKLFGSTTNKRTTVYTSSNKTINFSTSDGYNSKQVLDAVGRTISLQDGPFAPTSFTYDTRGRVSTVTRGNRVSTYAYDSFGNISQVTDPLNRVTKYFYDEADRLIKKTDHLLNDTLFAYDSNGKLTSITPAGRQPHVFEFDLKELLKKYDPPLLPSSVSSPVSYLYNSDRQVSKITTPTGNIDFIYNQLGEPEVVAAPDVARRFEFRRGLLTTAQVVDPEIFAQFSYLGEKISSEISSFPTGVQTEAYYRYNSNGTMRDHQIKAAGVSHLLPFTYNDGRLTGVGPMTVSTAGFLNRIDNTSIGTCTEYFQYDRSEIGLENQYGDMDGHIVRCSASTIFEEIISRDKLGRVTQVYESVHPQPTTYYTRDYVYDQVGRLSEVKRNGIQQSLYTYGPNGNRLTKTTAQGTKTATYDSQDRLVTYGSLTFTYNAAGARATKTDTSVSPNAVTQYFYNTFGNLTKVIMPDGTVITYVVDALGRRIAKRVNGVLENSWGYENGRISVEIGPTGRPGYRFVYATKAHSPDYAIYLDSPNNPVIKYVSDSRGSIRAVTDVTGTTPAVYKTISYDEFGIEEANSNPSLQTGPFGFAGGQYDRHTKLTRFGVREYDAETGTWLSKDPILFSSGDTNVYGYVSNDPINFIDPSGLHAEVIFWQPVGWGSSSFGHVSVNINGTAYSFGPGGMAIKNANAYATRNQEFRGGVGITLNLTPQQEAAFEKSLKNAKDPYSVFNNNCADVVEKALGQAGVATGNPFFPSSLQRILTGVPQYNGTNIYTPAVTNDSKLENAPWTR